MSLPIADFTDHFPALTAHDSWLAHGFVRRITGVDARLEKAEVLEILKPWHEAAIGALGFEPENYFIAEQVHGGDIAEVEPDSPRHSRNVDGLMTRTPGLLLGIHVADCAPVFVIDPVQRAIALLHSGKKGTEAGITPRAIARMREAYGTKPEDVLVQIGPCIRPPLYEIDFAAQIRRDALDAGVPESQVHDCGVCTGSDVERYYSYRVEKGKTGRLLALLGIRQDA